jgi:hypothetical protein
MLSQMKLLFAQILLLRIKPNVQNDKEISGQWMKTKDRNGHMTDTATDAFRTYQKVGNELVKGNK